MRFWNGSQPRAMLAVGVAASAATALAVAVSSPADSGGRGWHDQHRSDRAKNVIILQGDGMGVAQLGHIDRMGRGAAGLQTRRGVDSQTSALKRS